MAMQQALMDVDSMRNFKEFLEMYNKTTALCFNHCIVNLHTRDLTATEEKCINDCTSKAACLNHRILGAFMVEQPKIVQQKMETVQRETEIAMAKMEQEGVKAEQVSPEEMAKRMMEGMQNKVPSQ